MRLESANTRSLASTSNAGTVSMRAILGAGPKGEDGADGSNVLPTDTAISEAIENPASETAASLSASIAQQNGSVNAALQILPADDGDISLALRRAAVAAVAFGGSVFLPGGSYTAKSVFEVGDLTDVRIVLDQGARITVAFDGTFFRVAPPTWEAIQTCTPPAADAYWSGRSTIGVTNASAYAVGDIVRVVADDKAPSTRATPGDGTDYRIGQFAFVTAVNTGTNVLTLDRPLDAEYTWSTTPRVGRLPRRRVHWLGGKIGYETGHASTGGTGGTGWRGSAVIAYGVSDLFVDTEIEHAYNSAINAVGCYAPNLRARGGDITNNESNQQYGYLVNDSSEYADVDVRAGRNRHGYTTNQPLVAAASTSLHLYGETRRATIRGECHGDTQAGFDTHHGSVGCVFDSVHVTGGTTGGGQFVCRGRKHRWINPTGASGKEGMLVYSEAGVNSQTTDIEIVNPAFDVDRYPLVLDNASATLRGGYLRSRKYGQTVKVSTGSTLVIAGQVRIRAGSLAEINSYRTVYLSDSTVDATGSVVIFDLADIPNTATSYGIVEGDGSTGSTWRGGRLITVNDTYLTTAFYKKSGAAGTMNFGGNGMELETSLVGANPKTTMDITGANGVGFTGPWKWKHFGGGGGSDYIERTVSTAAYILPWYGRNDDRVIARLFVNTTPQTLGKLPNGTKLGQLLHISVTLAGGATLTLKHGTASYGTALKGAADIVFSIAETGVTLMWTGATWTSVGAYL